MPAWNNRDITIAEVELPGHSGSGDHLCLTILYHPELARVGEMAHLRELEGGAELLLGRQQLEFSAVRGESISRPLQDPYISRQPIVMQLRDGSLDLQLLDHRSSVSVNRGLIADGHRIEQTELRAGAVLMLARRIVLFLHYSNASARADDLCGMIGESDCLQRVRHLITRVAPTDTTVLVLGESGTGKELVARAIHQRSVRADKEMLSLNMAAIPAELAAAELFGVRRGAFTGAEADKLGFFARADGTTLFLDEVGDSANAIQSLLLRALQEGEIQPAGGAVEAVDVRAIAATDAGLESSDFSVALRHRLSGFEIHVPPLRERREDIGRLLAHLLADFMPVEADDNAVAVGQWALLLQDFACYDWPGNIRELINFARQIDIASTGSAELVVPDNILLALHMEPRLNSHSTRIRARKRSARDISDQEIRETMLKARYEISRSARVLEVSRQALYQRIESIPQMRTAANVPRAEVETVYHDCNGELESAAALLEVSRSGLRRRWRALELEPRES